MMSTRWCELSKSNHDAQYVIQLLHRLKMAALQSRCQVLRQTLRSISAPAVATDKIGKVINVACHRALEFFISKPISRSICELILGASLLSAKQWGAAMASHSVGT